MPTPDIESKLQAKSTGARVTPLRVESVIIAEYYLNAGKVLSGRKVEAHPALDLLTICVLVLKNGFVVTGESACADPQNFDAELGKEIARANAAAKVFPLEGYLLKTRLADTRPPAAA